MRNALLHKTPFSARLFCRIDSRSDRGTLAISLFTATLLVGVRDPGLSYKHRGITEKKMAKCAICTVKKGKRPCPATDGVVCSTCCGEFRSQEKCGTCSFFSNAALARNYSKVPHFGTETMANDLSLQNYAESVESTLCEIDRQHQHFTDKHVLKILELLMDRYFFGDAISVYETTLEEDGVAMVDRAFNTFSDLTDEVKTKIIAAIYRSVKRRSFGNREYLNFVSRFAGAMDPSGPQRDLPDSLKKLLQR
jgi:hypothetical protein